MGTASNVHVTFAQAQSAGNLIAVAIGWNAATSNVASVNDSAGNTYAAAGTLAAVSSGATGLSQRLYYASKIKAAAANTNVLTVTLSAAVDTVDLRALEYAGVTTLDATAGKTGSGTTTSCGPLTTKNAAELLFAAGMCTGVFSDAGANYTLRNMPAAADGDLAADQIVSTAGTYSAGGSFGAVNSGTPSIWIVQLATFY